MSKAPEQNDTDLLGFGRPNDFGNYLLRAKLSKQYGIFGSIPMWGGIRLHEFYPPLSTIIVRSIGMKWSIVAYLVAAIGIWSVGRDLLTCALLLVSYHHFRPLIEAGRFSELLGYLFVSAALFVSHGMTAGVLLGLGGLCYPSALIFGTVALCFTFDWTLYATAFVVCGPWYLQFIWKRRRLNWLQESRYDKVLGLYVTQWAMMANVAVFVFGPMWLKILTTASLWLAPISVRHQDTGWRIFPSLSSLRERLRVFTAVRPFYSRDLLRKIPGLRTIDKPLILLSQNSNFETLWLSEDESVKCQVSEEVPHNTWDPVRGSLVMLVWPCACWLIDQGIMVYNGLPSTEVPADHTAQLPDLPVYHIEEMMISHSTESKETKV